MNAAFDEMSAAFQEWAWQEQCRFTDALDSLPALPDLDGALMGC